MTSGTGGIATGGHWNWTAVPSERIGEGIERQMIWGERLMVCRLRFVPGVVTAVHAHPHEQVTLVEQGRVRFTVDGVERVATAGDVLFFPSNQLHGAAMLDDPVVLVDIFSPVREDYLPGGGTDRKEATISSSHPPR